MVAEVLHPVDVDSHIWCPMETLYQSPSSIVHTHPGNDLGDKQRATSSVQLIKHYLVVKTWHSVFVFTIGHSKQMNLVIIAQFLSLVMSCTRIRSNKLETQNTKSKL